MRKKTREGLEVIALLGLGSLAIALPLSRGAGSPTTPDRQDRVERGGQTYRTYCASCHGNTAEGNGPMAQVLKTKPADLARISQRNGGTFPEQRVASIIDGRLAILSHGPSAMPVWGLSFQDPGKDMDQEKEVQEKIKDLVAYLESVQK